MAFQASGGRKTIGMAILAGGIAVIDAGPVAGVWMRAVVAGRSPGGSIMAVIARRPGKEAGMISRVGVAGGAVRRKPGEPAVGVAAIAAQAGMSAREREDDIVVKGRRGPAAGGMAGAAVISECAGVGVILGVTGITIGGRALENIIGMAACASHADMPAGQWEARHAVVESGRLPRRGGMAGAAAVAERAAMGIILRMAGVAVSRRALEVPIAMAAAAGHTCMGAGQREAGGIVVEGGRLPRGGAVAGSAVRPQRAAVGIILRMAGVAV